MKKLSGSIKNLQKTPINLNPRLEKFNSIPRRLQYSFFWKFYLMKTFFRQNCSVFQNSIKSTGGFTKGSFTKGISNLEMLFYIWPRVISPKISNFK